MLKLIGLAAALAGGAYVAGVFDYHYIRVVDRPPAAVLAGLEHLDIRDAPGGPATDPARAGGVAPTFSHAATPTGMVYQVMSGDRVAVRMYADLEPLDGGKRTRVTTRIERGDAPDDFVAPAFRSKGVTAGLFDIVVDEQLDVLTKPKGDPERCRQLVNDFMMRAPTENAQHQDNLKDAIADQARAVMQISVMEQELRRNGCDTRGPRGFQPVSQAMTR